MITETIRRNLQSSTRWLQPAAHKCIFPASSTVSQQPTALCQAPTGFLLLIAFNFIGFYCNHFDNNCQDFLPKFWFDEYINYLYTSRRHGIYPYRHARAILMCLTLLNSFNHMKSFTMFIFSWLKFVKKRGTSIYLLRVYVIENPC